MKIAKIILGLIIIDIMPKVCPHSLDSQTISSYLRNTSRPNINVPLLNKSSTMTRKSNAEQIWIEQMSLQLKKWVLDDKVRIKMLQTVLKESAKANLDPLLILSVITVESKFNKYAISSSGAIGLMQVMPFWLNELEHPTENLFDVETNIHLGCSILREYLDTEKGNLFYALGRYNGSRGREAYPKLVLDAYQRYWKLENSFKITCDCSSVEKILV